ncbi:hypothetical protein [Tumebacillus permanentifrigoris]|uniref:Uncharacterized protein n=1 Tax=Tumebacillus permanentifrigoris TaxID=378543 RepID=A0A316D6T3_9BACL|nr:hypothetical protein [Tumebacillus permanentifrigoris]PWK05019.1 hypothetical protein C7459_12917 [Tumebacillus permanentifrigoris]
MAYQRSMPSKSNTDRSQPQTPSHAAPLAPHMILQLQKSLGNRAALQMLKAAHHQNGPVVQRGKVYNNGKGKPRKHLPKKVKRDRKGGRIDKTNGFKTRMTYKAPDSDYAYLQNLQQTIGSNTIDWQLRVTEIEAHIEHVRATLDPNAEDDHPDLEYLKNTFNAMKVTALTLDMDTKGIQEKYETELHSKKTRRTRSKTQAGRNPMMSLFNSIRENINRLGKIKLELEAIYPLGEKGFSAKGRAHAIEASDEDEDGYTQDTRWLQDIQIGGAPLTSKHTVYKEHLKVNDGTSDPTLPKTIKNVKYDNLDSRSNALTKLEGKIKDLKVPQVHNWSVTPPAADRGDGQASNMGGANSTAYAMLAGVDTASTKWEWLHVKAASLGGQTDGTNLVVGSRDVNTQMMPIESNLRLLAHIVQTNPSLYKHLHVEFGITNQNAIAKHKVDEIVLKWELVKKPAADVEVTSGSAKFKPLDATSSISKFEIEKIQESLKEERAKMGPRR